MALREACERHGLGATLTLHKELPIAGGVGGGSSDAAATLHMLNEMWGIEFGAGGAGAARGPARFGRAGLRAPASAGDARHGRAADRCSRAGSADRAGQSGHCAGDAQGVRALRPDGREPNLPRSRAAGILAISTPSPIRCRSIATTCEAPAMALMLGDRRGAGGHSARAAAACWRACPAAGRPVSAFSRAMLRPKAAARRIAEKKRKYWVRATTFRGAAA